MKIIMIFWDIARIFCVVYSNHGWPNYFVFENIVLWYGFDKLKIMPSFGSIMETLLEYAQCKHNRSLRMSTCMINCCPINKKLKELAQHCQSVFHMIVETMICKTSINFWIFSGVKWHDGRIIDIGKYEIFPQHKILIL